MGAICCCPNPSGDEFEDHPTTTSNSFYNNFLCLRFIFLQLFTGYGTTFQRIEGRSISSSSTNNDNPNSSGLTSQSSDNFSNDSSSRSIPRPLPFDTDQRYSRSHRDGLVYRREKSMNHLQEESQPLRRSISSSGMELLDSRKKYNEEYSSGAKISRGIFYIQSSSEEEDCCPTCLEEYTNENPKIITRCAHHFHLGCIYEWMERSDTCPICGKDMEFSESP